MVDFVSILSDIPSLTLGVEPERVSEILAKVDADEIQPDQVDELRKAVVALDQYGDRCISFTQALRSVEPFIAKVKLSEAVVI